MKIERIERRGRVDCRPFPRGEVRQRDEIPAVDLLELVCLIARTAAVGCDEQST
jgi:hypothetical protein